MQDTATKNWGAKWGDIFFLSNDDKFPPNNGAILTIATIIKGVIPSAAEVELGALYLNAKEVVYLWQILAKMGHPQPQTPIQTNNLMVEGVINHKIKTQTNKSNGHVLSLAMQPRSPRPISNLLATGKTQQLGLFYKTPLITAPC
jgi:hypothetical protein